MTKGADSIIIPRLKTGQDQLINKTLKYVEDYANEGLRTLLIAQK
jgi:phospholipid-translocating ATPase